MGRITKGCLWGVVGLVTIFVLLGVVGLLLDDGEVTSTSSSVDSNLAVISEEPSVDTVTPTEPVATEPVAASSEHFDRSNWSTLHSDPDAHKGATVEIVGRVFGAAERQGNKIGWQMWADAKNREWNTIVMLEDSDFTANDGDFVKVSGQVQGAFEGENAFGAKMVVPHIVANTATIVDATAAASPAQRTAEPNESISQHGLTLTLQKVEFADDETRAFLTLVNGTNSEASFYSFNAKAVQGSTQFDAESFSDYPEIQSELLAGIESSGVVVFPPMNPAEHTRLVFEARAGDYSLDFQPYTFEVQP